MRDDEILSHLVYMNLSKVTNKVCRMLLELQNKEVTAIACAQTNTGSPETVGIEAEMQDLVELVFGSSSNKIDSSMKQTFFAVARTFYYTAYISEETLNFHIFKVLFQKVQ
nr:copal-8-ol diphosphate hydratase, chloroplastic-like [Nicotiana tomentosiformis]